LNWGATGPTGKKGPTGATGISGYEVVTKDSVITEGSPGGVRMIEADSVDCPAGKSVLGGGGSGTWIDTGNFPHAGDVALSDPVVGPPARWYVGIAKPNGDFFATGEKASIHLVVICAVVS
jgi:hypothetical protein